MNFTVPSQVEQYLLGSVSGCPTYYCYLVSLFSCLPILLVVWFFFFYSILFWSAISISFPADKEGFWLPPKQR